MHRRLGSATLSELAFPGESNSNFPREKSHWDNTVVVFFFNQSKSGNVFCSSSSVEELDWETKKVFSCKEGLA